MAQDKTSTAVKTGILIQPLQIIKRNPFLQLLQIRKEAGLVHYQTQELISRDLKLFPDLPPNAKEALNALTPEGLLELDHDLEKKFRMQRSGLTLQQFIATAYNRQLLQLIERARPYFPLFKWYHQMPNPNTGNMLIAPCTFSNFTPALHFSVYKEGDYYSLQTHITINGEIYQLNDFRRCLFFLESRNEYFILKHKDFQTLEWIEKNVTPVTDATLFSKNILAPLEENYTVERNQLFEVNIVENIIPKQRVMLSEISNNFLVLTPQWIYDGNMVEGEWKEFFETTDEGQEVRIKRNKQAEQDFRKLLSGLHPNFPRQLNGWYYLSFADAQKKQWFLKVYHQLLEMNIELAGIDMLTHFRYSPHKAETVCSIHSTSENKTVLDFSVSFGKEKIPLHELQKIILAGQRAVMLKDGSLGVLGEEWLHTYGTIIKHSKTNSASALIAPKWLAISEQETAREQQQLTVSLTPDWWALWQQWQHSDDEVFAIPNGINATLRPYQQKGFEWMKLLAQVNAGACLADDMGLGKTLQTICFIADRLQQHTNNPALIVCPASLIYNWQSEIEKFAPSLRCYVHHGATRRTEQVSIENADVCITSYGTLRSDIEAFSQITFEVVVVDESHNIKSPVTQITRAVNQLQSHCRVALSGTPVMNNTFDLYSQLEFLLPGMFGSREFFKREYADAIDRDGNEEKVKQLQKLTAPFILRRTKQQVAKDLPEKTESVLWCNMSGPQRDLYEDIKSQVRSNLFTDMHTKGIGKTKLAVLQGIMKLKQICSSPQLLPAEEQTTALSAKTDLLLDEIQNLHNNKVLVFSQFAKMLELLAVSLTQKGISFYQLDGSTPAQQRSKLVADFQQEDNTTQVFLISLMAGNTGLTLTAADYVFLFDPWWNNAVEQQAIDRTHRIGQTKNVFAYKMICKDTIEEKIMQLQQTKKELSENLIGDTEGFVKQLTKEDVEFLFS
ncbi:MAG: DEAD/DEAH box helicase [Bacteroidetes bacterium]|nr:DEAD/DEAH box helicase [Bacteroidota bacterium]